MEGINLSIYEGTTDTDTDTGKGKNTDQIGGVNTVGVSSDVIGHQLVSTGAGGDGAGVGGDGAGVDHDIDADDADSP
jgi:hypothetical protein